jgi:hypothetical protein
MCTTELREMAYKQKVQCIDCALFREMDCKPKRKYCAYTGAKISMAQAKREIDCDFFIELELLNPERAGWRAYILPA